MQIKDLMDVEVDLHTSVNVCAKVVLVEHIMRSRQRKGPENVDVVVAVDVDIDIHASVSVDVGARVVSVADVMCR